MGICFSKKAIQTSSPTKENCPAKEEKNNNNSEVSEKQQLPLSAKKEEKEKKKKVETPTPVKKFSQFEEEKGIRPPINNVIPVEQLPAPLRTSSCTKEEVDAILIQCGRLSRSSSGKNSKETVGIGGNRRYSGSKRSYDFDAERAREEDEEEDKPVPRPSPRRRTQNRERSGSRERRVSRSPGRRSDGPVFTASVSDKQKPQQPAKMVPVPAREKAAPFVNVETGSVNFGAKRVTASPRSRSPANTARISNENPQTQSLSKNSSKKKDQSPCRRTPLTEMEDNSIKNQNGGSTTSSFQKNRAMDEVVKKQLQKEKQETMKEVNQVMQAKITNNVAEGNNNPITLTRTRSSRRSSRDLDNNPVLNPTASYASFLLEDIQTQHQNTTLTLPACISKACSILDAVADLNSSCSDRRSYEAEKSSTNINRNGGFMARGLVVTREQSIESELEVKDDIMEPCLHKYVTVRQIGREMDPQESAGSNSFEGMPWASSSLWDMNSVDSACGTTSLTGSWKDVEVEDEGNQQQRSSWRRSEAASGRQSPTGKKREFDRRQVQQGGGYGVRVGNGRVGGGRGLSLPVSAATF